jgi:hypothetical protein
MYDKEYHKEYYHKNKERINNKAKEWKAKNPEKFRSIQKKWEDNNRQKINETRQKYKKTLRGCLITKLNHLKKAKRSRVLECTINIDTLLELWELQEGRCAISNYPMRYEESSLFGVSVDRIDPSGGYTKENIQLVCQGINFAKNMYSNEEMIEFWQYRDKL